MSERTILLLLAFVGGFLIGMAAGYRRAETELASRFPAPAITCYDSLTAFERELLATALREHGDTSEDLDCQLKDWKR